MGKSAFAHKGGVHVPPCGAISLSYQHIDPELVGNQMRVVVSELSGRGNLLSKAKNMACEISATDRRSAEVLNDDQSSSKRKGFSFEAAEASVSHDAQTPGSRITSRPSS